MQTGKISLDAAIDEEFRNDFAQNEGEMSLDAAIDEEFRSSFAQSEKTPIEKVSLDSAIDEEFSPKATPSEAWRGSLFGAGGFRGDMEAPAIKPRQEVPSKGNGGYSAKEMFLGTATNPSLRQSGVPSLIAGEKSSLSPQELSRSLLDQANAMSNAEPTQEEQKESLLKKEILADELNKERSIMGRAAASGMGRQMGDVGYLANLLGASGLGDALQSEGSRLGENNPFTRPEEGWQKYAVSVAENLPFMAATMAGGVGAGALTSSAAAKLGAGKVLSTLVGLGAAGATRTAIEGAIEAGGAAGEASEMGMSKDEQRRVAGEVFGADFLKQTGLNAIEQVLELGGGSLKGLAPIAKLLGSKSGKALGVLGAGAIRGELEGLEEKMQEESVLDALGIDRDSPEGKARVAEARHMGRAMGWMFEATGLSLNGLTKVGDRMIDLGNKSRKETPSDQKQAYEDIISKVESGNLTAEELIPYLTATQKLGLASDAIQDLKDLRLRKRQGEELNEEEQSRLANLTEAIGLLSSEGEDAAISKMSEVFDVPEWVRSHMETETSPYMGTETGEVYVDSDQTAVVPRRNETAPATRGEAPSSLVPAGPARRPLADMTLENTTEYTPEEIEANRGRLRRLLGKITKKDLRERFGVASDRNTKKGNLVDRVIDKFKADSQQRMNEMEPRDHKAIPMGGADQRSDTIIEQPSQRLPMLTAGPTTPSERRAVAETPTQGAIVAEGEGDPYYGEVEIDARPGTERRAYRDRLKQHYNDKSQGVEIPVPGGGGGDAPPYPNPKQAEAVVEPSIDGNRIPFRGEQGSSAPIQNPVEEVEPYDDSGYDLLPRPERGDFDTEEDYESALSEWEMEDLAGEEQYQVQKESTETSAPPITKQSVESSFPGATVTEQDGGSFVVETPNGQVVTVHPDATITMNKDAANEAYGREMDDSDEAVGSFQSIDGEGVIRLTDKADQGTLDHETWHAAKSFVISEEDAATLKKDYANEEQEAEAYRQWVAGRRAKTTKRSGRIFQKILDFFSRIKANLFGKNSEDIFREVATGEAWEGKSRGQSPSEEQYSVKDAGDSETWQPIVDKMEGERVVRPTKEKKTIKERLKEGVEAVYDGYVDELLPLARAFGDKVYDLARVSLRGTSGPAMQMIERGSVDGRTKGLYQIFESLPKGEATGFMHYATYKHLLDVAENSENARQAQIELGKLASQAKKEASAMERRAAKEPKGSSDFKALQDQAKEARERAKALEKQADDLDSRIKKTVLNSTSYKWGIAELEKAYPHWKEAQRDLAQYSKEILGVLNEAGIISDELKKELNRRYPNYVPLQRDFGDEETVNAFIRTKGLVNLGTPIKKLKGSDRDVIDPVRQIIENTFRAYVLKGQNDVAREIVKQVDEGVIPEEVIKPTEDRHHGPTEHVFYVWEDGEKRLFKTDADIYHALMMTGSRHPGVKQTVFEAIAKYPTKAIRIGATRTVGFALRNMYRDNLHAGVVSENGFVPFYDGVRGLFHVLTKSDLYDEFLRSGGAMGTINAVDRNYFQEEYDKVRELDLDHPTVKNMRKKAWRFLSDIAEASENATRMGEYMRAKENGKSIKEAALSARDLQDFERGGGHSKSINSFSAFFNAGLQGMDKLIRAHGFPDMIKAFHETEGGIKATKAALEAFRWKTAVRAAMYLSLPSILTAMFNLADDDRKKAYLELPAWRKDLFWNIVLDPGNPDTGDKGFILSFPKPFELGVLYGSIPERFTVWLNGKDKKAFNGLSESLASTFPSVLPNCLVIPLELATNKSLFLGRDIVPQSEQKLSPGRQSGPYTSEFAKWAGRTFNVSPRKVDYTLRSTFSSLGGAALKTSDSVIQGLRGDPRPEIPAKEKHSFGFVNRGYKSPQSVQDFYDGLDDLETMVNDAKDKAKEGEPLEGRDKTAFRLGQKDSYTKDPAPLTRLRRIRTGIGQLSRDKSIIAERKGMTAEEKRREIDLIDARILSMARQGNTYIEELVKAVEND